MHLALLTTFAASRKEPLVEVLERVHAAIVAADFGEPQVEFVMADSPIAGGVSSVDRVLKRFPLLANFARNRGSIDRRRFSNEGDYKQHDRGRNRRSDRLRNSPRDCPRCAEKLSFSQSEDPILRARVLCHDADAFDAGWTIAGNLGERFMVGQRTQSIGSRRDDGRGRTGCAQTACAPGIDRRSVGRLRQGEEDDPGAADSRSGGATPVDRYRFARKGRGDPRRRARLPDSDDEILDRANLPHDLPPNSEAAATRRYFRAEEACARKRLYSDGLRLPQ